MKPDKGNRVIILDQKLCNNTISKIILDISKFEKFSKDPTLKHETFSTTFFIKDETKKLF